LIDMVVRVGVFLGADGCLELEEYVVVVGAVEEWDVDVGEGGGDVVIGVERI
jgi:hypothetical protein